MNSNYVLQHTNLNINIVNATSNSNNDFECLKFFKILLGECDCVPHESSNSLI